MIRPGEKTFMTGKGGVALISRGEDNVIRLRLKEGYYYTRLFRRAAWGVELSGDEWDAFNEFRESDYYKKNIAHFRGVESTILDEVTAYEAEQTA